MADFASYANGFQAVPRPGLERIAALTAALGDPQESLSCIHIAGTNGKGSVSVMLDSILRAAGYRVGLYTSPNLLRVNERIRVDGLCIPDDELSACFARIEQTVAEHHLTGELMPTQFEIWTAAAFLYFQKCGCDYVVLETGMGGEFDATNIIEKNVMAILTHIDLDHTAFLGNTIEEIARTKCGIIKSRCETATVLSAPQTEEAKSVISSIATEKGCTPVFVSVPAPLRTEGFYEVAEFPYYGEVRLGLPGLYQLENTALALACAQKLGVERPAVTEGLRTVRHPARFEVLRESPLILYDGGHNPDGIRALTAALARYLGDSPLHIVYACMKDKDFVTLLPRLKGKDRTFYFTTVQHNERALDAHTLARRADAECGIKGGAYPTLSDAVAAADDGHTPLLICGSLYLYADLPKEYLHPIP